ncbi:MAG: hypothetical protein EBV06_10730 [Planctomycetia bacterium]|nr:hypothetical protein [Planctomycetia bacterium]
MSITRVDLPEKGKLRPALRPREKNATAAGAARFEKPAPAAQAAPLLAMLTSRSSAGRPLLKRH